MNRLSYFGARSIHRWSTVALFAMIAACGDAPTEPTDTTPRLDVTLVATGFDAPVQIAAPAGDTRLFVVERAGRIRIVKDGVVAPRSFLDLTGLVSTFGSERGMLSLPMHYSYGLSVLNSHLAAGAAVVLSGHSFLRPEFWRAFDGGQCTSFASVPYTWETLHRLRFEAAFPKDYAQWAARQAPR